MTAKGFLRTILGEDEAIYRISRDYPAMFPIYVIGPQTEDRDDPGRYLDISGCIEDTLHRVLDAGGDVWSILGADKYDPEDRNLFDENGEPLGNIYELDLGYAILDFYPVSIEWEEDYEEPVISYILGDGPLALDIPESMNDEDILGMVCQLVNGFDQDVSVIRDLNNDGSEYAIQNLENGRTMTLRKAA